MRLGLAALLAATGIRAAAAQGCDSFHLYWNNNGGDSRNANFCTLDVSAFLISPANLTVTGRTSCLPGANYALWNQGVWPYISANGEVVAGGVPQAANLSLHLATIGATLQYLVPAFPTYAGNVVIDMEYWRPAFAGLAPAYRNLSIALVRAAHPAWNESSAAAEAQRQFEAAALDFMEATLRTYAALMPLARIGFYGYPENFYYPCRGEHNTTQCGYNDPDFGPSARAQNDAQGRLYAASSGLFPSIYLPSNTNSSAHFAHHADYVAATVAEASRLRDAHAPAAPVLPFAWNFYHDGHALLLPPDMATELAVPAQNGADGVILWGAPGYYNESAPMLAYLNATLGPLARQTVTSVCACAAQRCSGHGSCAQQGGCRCLPGFSGPSCSTAQ